MEDGHDAEAGAAIRARIEERVRILTEAFLAPPPIWPVEPIVYVAPPRYYISVPQMGIKFTVPVSDVW